jgi:hypothetical protein
MAPKTVQDRFVGNTAEADVATTAQPAKATKTAEALVPTVNAAAPAPAK